MFLVEQNMILALMTAMNSFTVHTTEVMDAMDQFETVSIKLQCITQNINGYRWSLVLIENVHKIEFTIYIDRRKSRPHLRGLFIGRQMVW